MWTRQQLLFVCIALFLPSLASAHDGILTESDIPPNLPPVLRQLIEKTFSSDLQTRKSAAKQLGEMGASSAPAIPFLIRLMHDENIGEDGWYSYADDALVAIGEPALDALIVVASNPASMSQYQAMDCLTKFDSPKAGAALLKLFEFSGADTREFAVECFRKLRYPQVVEPLLRDLNAGPWVFEFDSSVSRLHGIIEALGFQQDRRAVPALLGIVQNSQENIWLRRAAAQSLGQINDPTAFSILVRIYQDRSEPPELRFGAALGIGAIEPNSDVSAKSPQVEALGESQILELLGSVASNEDEVMDVRIAAARALGDFGRQQAIEILAPLAKSDGDNDLGFWAAVGVVKLSDGAIGDVFVANAVRDYHEVSEVNGLELMEQRNALQKIRKHGKWPSQLALMNLDWLLTANTLGVVTILVAITWLLYRRALRGDAVRAQQILPETQNS